MIDRRRFLGFSSGFITGWISISLAENEPSVSGIRLHTAEAEGFFSNSFFLMGNESTTLVDAQMTQQEAEKVIDVIVSIGKPLESVVITHSHIDHYAGLEFIGPAFPEATIYSAEASIRQIADTSRHWPEFTNTLTALPSGRFEFSQFDLDCLVLPDAESVSPLVLYYPEEHLIISGDHYLSNQHLWLAEGRAGRWLDNLDTIEDKWEIRRILPGHGEPGGPDLSNAVREYIGNFQNAVINSENFSIAMLKMLQIYPEYRLRDVLEVSLLSAFSKKGSK